MDIANIKIPYTGKEQQINLSSLNAKLNGNYVLTTNCSGLSKILMINVISL